EPASRQDWRRYLALRPARERVGLRFVAIHDQIRYPPPPSQQRFQKLLERILLAVDPLRRGLLVRLVDHLLREVYDLIQPGLEIVQRSHRLIHQLPRIEALNRRIREVPMWTIECDPVVDHEGE